VPVHLDIGHFDDAGHGSRIQGHATTFPVFDQLELVD